MKKKNCEIISVSDVSEAGGNTSTPAKSVETQKKRDRARRWSFTLFKSNTEKLEKFKRNLASLNCLTILGVETCPESGKEHIQGYLECKNQIEFSTLQKLWKGIHLEKSIGSQADNVNYCSKEGNVYYSDFKVPKPLKILDFEKLYNWQKDIVNLCKTEPDDRKIYWYWGKNGCNGKTQLCKHLVHHHKAVVMMGKCADCLHFAVENESDIYIFLLARSREMDVSYEAMEYLKDGLFMSGKYEGGMVIRNSPHVIVMANFEPDKSALSKDRWIIRSLE